MQARPIGVFDSGVGGLSVLRAIHAALPLEDLIYVADSAHAPYGDRDAAFIVERAVALTGALFDAGAKAVVVACNTATVVAIDALRERFALPIVALEPAIKPAVAATRSGVVAVLATSRTLQSESVARLVRLHAQGVRVLLQPCPGLVERIERGEVDSPATGALLEGFVQPLLAQGADTIVLGCTHYPFVARLLRRIAGASVVWLDSADAVARQVQRRVPPADPDGDGGSVSFFTSGEPARVQPLLARLWGTAVVVRSIGEMPRR